MKRKYLINITLEYHEIPEASYAETLDDIEGLLWRELLVMEDRDNILRLTLIDEDADVEVERISCAGCGCGGCHQ